MRASSKGSKPHSYPENFCSKLRLETISDDERVLARNRTKAKPKLTKRTKKTVRISQKKTCKNITKTRKTTQNLFYVGVMGIEPMTYSLKDCHSAGWVIHPQTVFPNWIRTNGHTLNRRMLYQLSYWELLLSGTNLGLQSSSKTNLGGFNFFHAVATTPPPALYNTLTIVNTTYNLIINTR